VAYTGLKVDRPEYKHMQDNKLEAFLSHFPHGKVPAFRAKNGFTLTEGAAIARYCMFVSAVIIGDPS
jgi:elongation factor 1-gamma